MTQLQDEKQDYGYSYEIYTPETNTDVGSRVDYEDHFTKRTSAVAAMMESMGKDDVPVGSTAFVCRRYDDGEMTDTTVYIKRETCVVIIGREAK